jgi:hypothetical protein
MTRTLDASTSRPALPDLSPCPFCGGGARINRKSGVTGRVCRSRFYRETVTCKSCKASTTEHNAPGRAAGAWNRRSVPLASGETETRKALESARQTMRHALGAVESNQIDDKDVRRQLSRGIADIDAALASDEGWQTQLTREQLAGMGYAIVPREPKPEMIGAWYRVKNGHHFHDEPTPPDTSDYTAYRAMIAAATPLAEPRS